MCNFDTQVTYSFTSHFHFSNHFLWHYYTGMYYMLVTIATVGYGDITPDSVLGRFSAMLMIVIAIIMVPQMTNALLEKLARQVRAT